MSSRRMSLLPRATFHSDSEQHIKPKCNITSLTVCYTFKITHLNGCKHFKLICCQQFKILFLNYHKESQIFRIFRVKIKQILSMFQGENSTSSRISRMLFSTGLFIYISLFLLNLLHITFVYYILLHFM
jgi:hypothetical protein